jgi:hypothetical protein
MDIGMILAQYGFQYSSPAQYSRYRLGGPWQQYDQRDILRELHTCFLLLIDIHSNVVCHNSRSGKRGVILMVAT